MDPVTQALNSIPGFQGSVQQINRTNLEILRANGFGDAWWIPDFIRDMTVSGWL